MQFGVSFLPDCREEWKSATEYFSDALALCTLAESAGFVSVKMTEHYLTDDSGYCPSPLSFLSAVAARTTRMRLITDALLPAFHHPVQLAAETAMVDAISGGRLEVGFARAYLPQEFEAFGSSLDESTARYQDTLRAVLRLWTEQRIDEKAPSFSYRQVTGRPSPVQRPHPPVWGGAASRTPDGFPWLGGNGFGLLTPSGLNRRRTYGRWWTSTATPRPPRGTRCGSPPAFRWSSPTPTRRRSTWPTGTSRAIWRCGERPWSPGTGMSPASIPTTAEKRCRIPPGSRPVTGPEESEPTRKLFQGGEDRCPTLLSSAWISKGSRPRTSRSSRPTSTPRP